MRCDEFIAGTLLVDRDMYRSASGSVARGPTHPTQHRTRCIILSNQERRRAICSAGFSWRKRLGSIVRNDIFCRTLVGPLTCGDSNRVYRPTKPFVGSGDGREGEPGSGPGTSSSRTSIIEALLENGLMSRSDLANSLGLSRSALTVLSRGLIDQGLILESSASYENQQTGRPSILLSLNAEHGYFIGAGLTEDPPMMVLTDFHGNSLAQHRMREAAQPRAVASAIEAGITELIRARKISRQRVLGIGVALSGYVDHAKGICLQSNALDWRDVPLAEIIERATKLPTYIDNDAHAVATGEKLFGRARESKNFSIVMLGKKIGEGHYINGRLHRGHSGAAGEIGHYTVVPGGEPCGCGKRGCLDMFATSVALLQKAAESRSEDRDCGAT